MNHLEQSPRLETRSAWSAIRHYVVTFMFAIWLGGFTFYALVVVPTGHQVLHSKVRQGFITQSVTNKLNVLGAVTLGLLLWQMLAARKESGTRGGRRIAWISWIMLAATLAALFWIHPHLDSMLDAASRSVTNDDRFYKWHRWYLIAATVQWLAGVVHLACLPRSKSGQPSAQLA